MNNKILLVTALILAGSLDLTGSGQKDAGSSDSLQIVATTSIVTDVVSRIAVMRLRLRD